MQPLMRVEKPRRLVIIGLTMPLLRPQQGQVAIKQPMHSLHHRLTCLVSPVGVEVIPCPCVQQRCKRPRLLQYPHPPVRLSSTRPALLWEGGNQREVEKEQSVPVVQVETQVLPESHPQTISQEGDMPDRVMAKGDSTAAANDPPSNPSEKGSVVPQNSTTTPPSNTSSQDILLMWS